MESPESGQNRQRAGRREGARGLRFDSSRQFTHSSRTVHAPIHAPVHARKTYGAVNIYILIKYKIYELFIINVNDYPVSFFAGVNWGVN